jgi:hypothetical protein
MRAGTTDRQDVVDRLSRHFAEGRLDTAEFDTRVGKAYAATYLDELPELMEDLPEPDRQLAARGAGRYQDFAGNRPGLAGNGYRPDAWAPGFHRPPRWLGAVVLIGVLFTLGALTHGIFLFPLIWLAMAFSFAGRRRHRWDRQNPDARSWDRHQWDRSRWDAQYRNGKGSDGWRCGR